MSIETHGKNRVLRQNAAYARKARNVTKARDPNTCVLPIHSAETCESCYLIQAMNYKQHCGGWHGTNTVVLVVIKHTPSKAKHSPAAEQASSSTAAAANVYDFMMVVCVGAEAEGLQQQARKTAADSFRVNTSPSCSALATVACTINCFKSLSLSSAVLIGGCGSSYLLPRERTHASHLCWVCGGCGCKGEAW